MSEISEKIESNQMTKAWCRSQSEVVKVEFDWFIENFSLQSLKGMDSSHFVDSQANEWYLQIFAGGLKSTHEVFASLFLVYCSCPGNPIVPLPVSFKITLMNNNQKIMLVLGPQLNEFSASNNYSGAEKAISLHDLFKEENNFLPDDVLHIKCEFTYKAKLTTQSGSGSYPQSLLPLSTQKGTWIENFKELLDNHSLADLAINIQGQTFNAHKLILSARSPVFHAMFQTELSEKKTNTLEVRDIKPAVFKEVLRFIYTDEVEKLEEMASDLLPAADKYMLSLLKSKCEAHLATQISVETCGKLCILAHLYSVGLKERVLDFVRCHSADVVKTTGWQELLQSADSQLLRDISVGIMTPRSQPIN